MAELDDANAMIAAIDSAQASVGLSTYIFDNDRAGERFARRGDGAFELNPAGIDDYLKLFEALRADAAPKAIHIVHLGSLTREDREPHSIAASQEFGFYSLLHIAQALGELDVSIPVSIGIVSNRLHEVTGEEHVAPEMATVLGPCGVITKEFPNVKCFNVDLAREQMRKSPFFLP